MPRDKYSELKRSVLFSMNKPKQEKNPESSVRFNFERKHDGKIPELYEFAVIKGIRYYGKFRVRKVAGEFWDWNEDGDFTNETSKEDGWLYRGEGQIVDLEEGYTYTLGFETNHFPASKKYTLEEAIIRSAQKLSEDFPSVDELVDYSLQHLIDQGEERDKIIFCDHPGEIPLEDMTNLGFFMPEGFCILTNQQAYTEQ